MHTFCSISPHIIVAPCHKLFIFETVDYCPKRNHTWSKNDGTEVIAISNNPNNNTKCFNNTIILAKNTGTNFVYHTIILFHIARKSLWLVKQCFSNHLWTIQSWSIIYKDSYLPTLLCTGKITGTHSRCNPPYLLH